MMTKIAPPFCFIALSWCFQSCNPTCESSPNFSVPPGPYQEGTELAITSNPPTAIAGRKIFLSFRSLDGANTTDELQSRFEEELGAAVVALPNEVNPDITFLVEDPDCGSLIPIGASRIENASFFIDNPVFITPTPPLIVIPTPAVTTPPLIVEDWFSSTNRDYCVWFEPETTVIDGDTVELPTLIPAPEGTKGPGPGSMELSASCDGLPDNKFYHRNPVSGIVDKEKNFIRIKIDRTGQGLGIEEFVGEFIDPDKLPEGTDYDIGGACESNGNKKQNIMFLTSLQTQRQLILWRTAD